MPERDQGDTVRMVAAVGDEVTAMPSLPDIAPDRLSRIIACGILFFDSIAGFGWLLGSPNRSSGPIYRRINRFLDFLPGAPARWWGALLVVMVLFAAIGMLWKSELWTRRAFSFLLTYWVMWCYAYAWGVASDGSAGFAAFALAGTSCLGHLRPIFQRTHISRRR